MMTETPRPPRWRTALVFTLVLLPLVITAAIKYLPALTGHQKISSIAILHPHLIGPKEYIHLENDVAKRLHEALAEVSGLVVVDVPERVGTSALVVPTLTIDGGLVQLNLQIFEARTGRIIFNTSYQSSIDNYPNMMKAAGAGLKRALL